VLHDGVAYDLPRRPLGRARLVGFFLIVFGAIFAAGPLALMLGFALNAGGWLGWLFLLFDLPFLLVGLALVGVGLAIAFGRATIELRRSRITAVERVGPLRWRRTRDGSTLQRIDVKSGSTRQGNQPLAELAGMTAEFRTGKRMFLAAGYPASWLSPLAKQIAADLERERPADLTQEQGEDIEINESEIGEGLLVPELDLEDAPRPSGTLVTLAENPDGVTLTIPPAGLRKGSKGLFSFAILWCGFMTVFSSISVIVPATTGKFAQAWPFLAFSALFWAIGIWMLIAAINMGRRHAIIDVVEDVLLINRKNLFGLKSHQWRRDEIETIAIGPSGMSVNDIPVLELKIRLRDETETGLFAGRDTQELRWIASVLRQALA
jgi:hypothetical protein